MATLLKRKVDFHWLLVLGTAAITRLPFPGLYEMIWDEAAIMHMGLRLGRYGDWVWLSNKAGWSWLPGHSPFSAYLAAIPYLVSVDPRAGRLFVGLLGIATVGLLYWLVRHYFGRAAGLFAGLLLAVHAPAVEWSRFVWNPNFAPPFIALWMVTGLLGYHEHKRWAQPLHWLALSLAVQAHPGNAMLGLVSLGLVLGQLRRPVILGTALGWVLALLSLVPWGIGILSARALQPGAVGLESVVSEVARTSFGYSLADSTAMYAGVTGSFGRTEYPYQVMGPSSIDRAELAPGNIWPPAWVNGILAAQAVLALVATVWLLYRFIRLRRSALPDGFLALAALCPLLNLLIADTGSAGRIHFYIMAMAFAAVPATAILLHRVGQAGGWIGRFAVGIFGILIAAQAWLTAASLRWEVLEDNAGRFNSSMQRYLDGMRFWTEQAAGRDVIVLAETEQNGKRGPVVQETYWEIMREVYPARIVNLERSRGIPIAAGGAVVASTYDAPTLPALFGAGEPLFRLQNGEPYFRWARASPPTVADVSLTHELGAQFGDKARVLGVRMRAAPQAGQLWPISIIWQPLASSVTEPFRLSVRLVDGEGTPYGQIDGLALDGWLWQVGDTVISSFDVPVADDYPLGEQPRVWLLMYGDEELPVLDDAGNWLAPWMFLSEPTRLFAEPALDQALADARFENGVQLAGFRMKPGDIQPGGTLDLTLVWRSSETPTASYRVFVHLMDADGNLRAQHDSIPGNWSRPTWGWLPGEYVEDLHPLALPDDLAPGVYSVFAGLVDVRTEQRLPLAATRADRYLLAKMQVN